MRLLLLSFVFLSACAGLRNNDPQQLYGKTWRQLDKAESHLAELQFTPNGRVAGTDGCNRFTARVDVTERMQLNAIGSSKMFCEHGADQRFSRRGRLLRPIVGGTFGIVDRNPLVDSYRSG
jgi:heat shock protein HslJ